MASRPTRNAFTEGSTARRNVVKKLQQERIKVEPTYSSDSEEETGYPTEFESGERENKPVSRRFSVLEKRKSETVSY